MSENINCRLLFPTVAASARVGGRSKQLEIYQTFAELKYVSDDESFQDEIDLHDMQIKLFKGCLSYIIIYQAIKSCVN